ncbi:TcdA/TcdB catalytic glycosyltransferase domain-containing protein [Erwinia sp. HR93]|uniref:TcdA/TcdB catalytic glycosyltransferase domain-containing protein n=1 Tax=Erwinia sp. HR93 TaxID=3094840 RepID=UPI002ADEEEDB|nr:TcdA/TcdB catalytic glycosyltransferase domain-containing protein [Erwinia sp. HR93]MEA1065442.1 TcdA/TcdB catalytic glycosyltransferase domain-containing protein [Erwinia sp. HR93]
MPSHLILQRLGKAIEAEFRAAPYRSQRALARRSRVRELEALAQHKLQVPDILHFIWIGAPAALDSHYLTIWKAANPDKTLWLWHDPQVSQCQHFQARLMAYARKISPHAPQATLRQLQNAAFRFIWPRLAHPELTFNALAERFLYQIAAEKTTFPAAQGQASLPAGVELMEITPLFHGAQAPLKRLYYYELILRGNLASASDIVRLLVLNRYGGIYIDIDTLPCLDTVFPRTHRLLETLNLRHDEAIALAKSERALAALLQDDAAAQSSAERIDTHPFLSPRMRCRLKACMHADTHTLHIGKIPALGAVFSWRDWVTQSSTPALDGIYYSNVLACCPQARVLRLTLRTLNKRYRFLERRDAIFHVPHSEGITHSLARLLGWREEGLKGDYGITPALTGPGLLLEVQLAAALRVLGIEKTVAPHFLAVFMQHPRLGAAFVKHTLDTPLGLRSAWRR